jgi:hypothetical protein
MHLVTTTAVHGADASAAKDYWYGTAEGTEVVAHNFRIVGDPELVRMGIERISTGKPPSRQQSVIYC